MENSKRRNRQAEKQKPSVPQSIAVYGAFIYKTLEYFGIKGTDIIEWLETLPPKIPDIWEAIQHLF